MTYSRTVMIYFTPLSSVNYMSTAHQMHFLFSYLPLASCDMGKWTAFLGDTYRVGVSLSVGIFTLCIFIGEVL